MDNELEVGKHAIKFMADYKIIGGDHKQYGPISGEDVHKWIAEGRLNAQSLAQAQGDIEWKQLSAFPEFAGAFASKSAMPGATPTVAIPTDLLERNYKLDIGGCISRGWNLFKNNFGLLFVGVLIYLLIEGAIAGLGIIPFIGLLFSIANLVIVGPLIGGVFYVFIQTIRDQPASVSDVFAGFRKAFVQLFLGHLVPALLAGLCLIPALVLLVVSIIHSGVGATPQINPLLGHHPFPIGVLLPFLGVLLVCLIPMIYLQISWSFTLPLIIDKQMDFWLAMKVSWKMVNKHWWHVLGLMILIGLINLISVLIGAIVGFFIGLIIGLLASAAVGLVCGFLAGGLICGVCFLFTAPIGIGALMYAYETIFSQPQAS